MKNKLQILNSYNSKKYEIKNRLNEFKNLLEEQQFKEFLFCLLTPQSNAQRCWLAVEELSKLSALSENSIKQILSTKTRFHHTKTKRILEANETWKKIQPLLNANSKNKFELRNQIAEIVNGYGLKEASHFLRNIGHSENQIAILDRHILKNLYKLNIVKQQKIKSKKDYLEIEKLYLNFSSSLKIPSDELDFLWWSQENGEIFK